MQLDRGAYPPRVRWRAPRPSLRSVWVNRTFRFGARITAGRRGRRPVHAQARVLPEINRIVPALTELPMGLAGFCEFGFLSGFGLRSSDLIRGESTEDSKPPGLSPKLPPCFHGNSRIIIRAPTMNETLII